MISSSQHRDIVENLVAGASIAFGKHFAKEMLDICPADATFMNPYAGAVYGAVARAVESGTEVDLITVAEELRRSKSQCTADELAEIVSFGELSTTRESARRAAQALFKDEQKATARLKAEKALEVLRSDAPPECAIELLGEARAAAEAIEARGRPRPLQIDLNEFSGLRYLGKYPPAFTWLIKGSLPSGCLGVVAAPPGAGKSTLSVQMAVALASGTKILDCWEPAKVAKVIYVSAEDSDEAIHRRMYHALMSVPEDRRHAVASRILAIPVQGRVSLCQETKGELKITRNMSDLRAIIEEFRPDVLFLDTLARFLCIGENDNGLMTEACAALEEVIRDYGCSVILLHHVNKTAGDCVSDESLLSAALTQTAIRGASALAGCVRWALLLAPLGEKLAASVFPEIARGKPSGSFVAARVGKKNIGAPESRFYFGRDEHGLLYPVTPSATTADEADARALAEEVRRREDAGEPPLSASKGASEVFGFGITKGQKVTEQAIQLGLIETSDKAQGKGKVLKFCLFQNDRNFGMFNYDE